MRKRILIVGVFTLLCILLIGCSTGKGSETTSVTSAASPVAENPTSAPIQELTSTPVPTPTPSPTPTPTPMLSNWDISYYVDDFGDKTNDAYVYGNFEGTWTSTISSDPNDLDVALVYDGKDYSFFVFVKNYSYVSPQKETFSTFDKVSIKFKLDGEEYSIKPIIIDNGEYLFMSNKDEGFRVLKKALHSGKEIRFVVKEDTWGTVFKFTIDGIGFKETLKKAKID